MDLILKWPIWGPGKSCGPGHGQQCGPGHPGGLDRARNVDLGHSEGLTWIFITALKIKDEDEDFRRSHFIKIEDCVTIASCSK